MKKFLFAAAAFFLSASAIQAQSELPSTLIKDINTGKKVAFNETIEMGKVTVIGFWATWCGPCKKEIKNFKEKLPGWHSEMDFNYMTVSIDETRAEGLARSYAKAQAWDFPYYIDTNGDLKRSLNFQTVPFTVIIDKQGKVAWSHSGYEEGGENIVMEKVRELSK